MRGGKKLFSFIEVDENTPIQKLSVMDQIRVLIKNMAKDDASELIVEDAVTQARMELKANLVGFIDTALDPIRKGNHQIVSLSVSNKFDPVLDEVLNSSRISNYYTVKITRPDIEYDIPYNVRVDIEVKQ